MTTQENNQSGFGIVELLVVVVAVVVLCGAGWFVYQHNRTKATSADASDTQPTQTTSKQSSTTSKSPAQVSATTVVQIPELGIQITVPNSIQDLTYKVGTATLHDGRSETYAEFSTASLAAADANCGTNFGPLGSLAKISGQYPTTFDDSDPPIEYGQFVKQFSTYFISASYPQAACSTAATAGSDAAAASNEATASADLKALNSSFSTIQATN
jgi:type II secretory pathway pseudopilin PulG